MPVQEVVYSTYRFLYMSATCFGSAHDSLAFSSSALALQLEGSILPLPFYMVRGDAYDLKDYLLTPILSYMARPNIPQDAYNYFQSSLRLHVEKAFG